jgi:3-oxoacyl-[acyl-carrier-protein] synthase II
MDDCLRYALVSGKKALEQAGLKQGSDAFNALNKQRCAHALTR